VRRLFPISSRPPVCSRDSREAQFGSNPVQKEKAACAHYAASGLLLRRLRNDLALHRRSRQESGFLKEGRNALLPAHGHNMDAVHAGNLLHLLDDFNGDLLALFLGVLGT